MLRKVAVIIEEESLITENTNVIFFGIYNLSNEVSVLNTQTEITAIITRLYITSSWYLR